MIRTEENVATMRHGWLKKSLETWVKRGQVSDTAADEILAALEKDRAADVRRPSPSEPRDMVSLVSAPLKRQAESALAGLSRLIEPPPPRRRPLTRLRGGGGDSDLDSATNTARHLTGRANKFDGLDDVAALDAPSESTWGFWAAIQPLLNTYVWWFIGTVLLLAGSIMGIREAWLALSGVPRQMTVLAALFAYHALFAGLGAFLAGRSRVTGALLGSIALFLLPVPFAVASDIYSLDASSGVTALGTLTILSMGSIMLAAVPFQAAGLRFLAALLPSLAAQAAVPIVGSGLLQNVISFVPFVPVLLSVRAAGAARDAGKSEGQHSVLGFSLYGALAVIVVFFMRFTAVAGSFSPGSVELGVLLLWLLALCMTLSSATGVMRGRTRMSAVYTIAGVVFLAGTLAISTAASLALFTNPAGTLVILTPGPALHLAVPIFTAFLFLTVVRRHVAAIHPFLFLSMLSTFLAVRDVTGDSSWWFAAAGLVPYACVYYQKQFPEVFRFPVILWGLGSGAALCLLLLIRESQFVRGEPAYAVIVGGALFAVAAHRGAGLARHWLHLAGGLGLVTAATAALPYVPSTDLWMQLAAVLGGAAAFYGILALPFEKLAAPETLIDRGSDSSGLMPLDDLSLGFSLAAALCVMQTQAFTLTGYESLPALAAGLVLLLRSVRERSRLISFLGAGITSIWVFRQVALWVSIPPASAASPAMAAFGAACVAGAWAVFASLLGRGTPADGENARKVFLYVRLPFPARGRLLFRDGFAAVSLLAAAYGAWQALSWLGQLYEPHRLTAIEAGLLITVTLLLAFFGTGFTSFKMRGSVATLALVFVGAGLTAVVNRVGRPLPPTVVGLNLTLGIAALFVFSRLLFHKGGAISARLGAGDQGRLYHHVPLAGSGVLGLVLLLDVIFLQPAPFARLLYVVPPTFFLGAGLAVLLYGRTLEQPVMVHAALFLFICAAALAFAQGTVTGTPLVALDRPGGRWVPAAAEAAARTGNWLDPSVFLPADVFPQTGAETEARSAEWGLLFAMWSLGATGLLAWVAFGTAFVLPGAVALLGSIFLFAAGRPREAALSVALNGLLVVHGLAHMDARILAYAGPILALMGLALAVLARPISAVTGLAYGRTLESCHMGAAVYGAAGMVYSLAAGAALNPDNAVPALVAGAAAAAFNGQWIQNPALGLTAALYGITLFAGSLQWSRIITSILAAASLFIFAFAALAILPFACINSACPQAAPLVLLQQMTPYFFMAVALSAAVAHTLGRVTEKSRPDWSVGSGWARDGFFALSGILFMIDQRGGPASPLLYSRIVVIVSVILVILLALEAAHHGLEPRHIYVAQVGIASLYAAMKPLFGTSLSQEADALFALGFGFVLVGVTALALRAEIPPLAESTRRFAALMPILAAVVLPKGPSLENAGMAALSGGLYSGLAVVSGSRPLAVLAALAVNLAFVTAALASQVQGAEVYLAPVGLLTLLLGHIFRESLSDRARAGVRIAGGLLTYVPSAFKIAFEIGRAADASYALVFGFICLVGVAAGMVMRIRSYLFMGALFLFLDVAANLVQAGLRDQRMAFILMSATGLCIIGGLVTFTLRRESLSQALTALSTRMRDWE
ncbi:MAG: hypothetical protein HY042_07285 [Spirochaetia bacterium]|nr:hypothetical protein [Spirochaetia bacterium]